MTEPALKLITPDTLDNDGKVVGKRGAKAYKKWVPKEWRPEYEAIVALSCTGLSNKEVGARFGYGPQQVSNICNTPQGKKLKEIISERLRVANVATFEERFAALGEVALKNIEDVLGNEGVKSKAPLAIFDRSMSVLKALGKVRREDNPPVAPNGVPLVGNAKSVMILTHDADKALAAGLQKAQQAKLLHGTTECINPKSDG